MIDDEILTLFFYGDELDARQREQIAAALASDPMLAERYADLQRALSALQSPEPIAAPPSAVIGWRYALDSKIEAESRRHRPTTAMWLIGAAAMLVAGIGIGLRLSSVAPAPAEMADALSPDIAATTPAAATPPLALTRSLAAHLQETRLQLVGLHNAGDQDRVELITRVIEQNRLFEYAAQTNGAPELARVLRAFEQMLVELARAETPPSAVADTTSRLSFEYAVMLTKLTEDGSDKATSF